VPLSSAKRAWIVIGVLLLCLIIGGAAYYYFRMSRPLPPIVSTVPGVPVAGPPPDLFSQLPADAPVVAYIDAANLRKLQNSPLAAALGLASPGPQADREYADFVRDTGFDYTRDLDHAAIAIWPAGFGTSTNVLGANRALVIADGRFDEQKIRAYAGKGGTVATGSPDRAITVVPGNPPVSFEFLSPTRIALASGPDMQVPLQKLFQSRAGTRDPAMQARIQRVAGAPLFAVAHTDHLPSSFYANFRNAPQLDQLARSVQDVTLAGQPNGDNLRVTLDLESDSMKNAVQISFLLETGKMAGSMALSDPRTRSQMTKDQYAFVTALINRAVIKNQNKVVRLTLEITPDILSATPPKSAASGHAPATPRQPATPPAAYPHSSQ
jgi:hypothetical protein